MSERDLAFEEHLTIVARTARLTAQQLNLPKTEVDRIQLAAILHDLGKTAVPDSLLNKPGPLSAEEWRFMRTHTLIGERPYSMAVTPDQALSELRAAAGTQFDPRVVAAFCALAAAEPRQLTLTTPIRHSRAA